MIPTRVRAGAPWAQILPQGSVETLKHWNRWSIYMWHPRSGHAPCPSLLNWHYLSWEFCCCPSLELQYFVFLRANPLLWFQDLALKSPNGMVFNEVKVNFMLIQTQMTHPQIRDMCKQLLLSQDCSRSLFYFKSRESRSQAGSANCPQQNDLPADPNAARFVKGAFKTWILSRSVEEKVNFETIIWG